MRPAVNWRRYQSINQSIYVTVSAVVRQQIKRLNVVVVVVKMLSKVTSLHPLGERTATLESGEMMVKRLENSNTGY